MSTQREQRNGTPRTSTRPRILETILFCNYDERILKGFSSSTDAKIMTEHVVFKGDTLIFQIISLLQKCSLLSTQHGPNVIRTNP